MKHHYECNAPEGTESEWALETPEDERGKRRRGTKRGCEREREIQLCERERYKQIQSEMQVFHLNYVEDTIWIGSPEN